VLVAEAQVQELTGRSVAEHVAAALESEGM